MALMIGLLWSSAVQNDRHITLVLVHCRNPQETNPNGHWGVNSFFDLMLVLAVMVVASRVTTRSTCSSFIAINSACLGACECGIYLGSTPRGGYIGCSDRGLGLGFGSAAGYRLGRLVIWPNGRAPFLYCFLVLAYSLQHLELAKCLG
jgi:hypothetical protein